MRTYLRGANTMTMFFTLIAFLAVAVMFLLTFFYAALGAIPTEGAPAWMLFSFASGLMALVLPCTFPILFVVVPLALGKGVLRSLGMVLTFTVGVMTVMTLYGVFISYIGAVGLSFLPLPVSSILDWPYVFGGIFAYVLALGELGVIKLRMPSYVGIGPAFIRSKKDFSKMFYLGLFMGNIGVACPYPAVPLLVMNAAVSGDVAYGGALFFVHAAGRVLPLFILLTLATLGVSSLNWLTKNKEHIDRANGWVMVSVAAFIATFGLTKAWLLHSKVFLALYALIEGAGVGSISLRAGILESYLATRSGTLFLFILVLLPLWLIYKKQYHHVWGKAIFQMLSIEHKVERLEEERRAFEPLLHIPEGGQHARLLELTHKIDTLLVKRRVLEEGARYGAKHGLRNETSQSYEEEALRFRRDFYLALSLLLAIFFYLFL